MTIRTVKAKPERLSIDTLCRIMDDCLPPEIDDARDMQRLIDKLWPALVAEFSIDVATCKECGKMFEDGSGESEFITWHGICSQCAIDDRETIGERRKSVFMGG